MQHTTYNNLFNLINENNENINEQIANGNIIFIDKNVEDLNIPKIFFQDKKIKKFKDLKYFQIIDLEKKINKNYFKFFKKYINLACRGYIALKNDLEKAILITSGYDILVKRSQGYKLEQIGESKNVTKERIRQIESTAYSEIFYILELYIELSFLHHEFENLLFLNTNDIFAFINNSEVINVINFVLSKKNDNKKINYSNDFSTFINMNNYKLINIINNLIELTNYFNYYDMYSKINDELIFKYNILDFSFEIFKKYLVNKKYNLKGNLAIKSKIVSTNLIISDFIKNNYPKGIVLDDEGIIKLKNKMQETYEYDFKVSSALSKIDELNPELIICGKQKRIHIDCVSINKDKLTMIINEFDEMFSDNNYMTLDSVYCSLKDIIANTCIDSKYYLYGVLKYYLKDKYYFKKMAVRKLELKDYTLDELVYNYINDNDLCSIDDIVTALEINLSTAQSLIRENPAMICINNKYTLANKIKISEDTLERIKIKLQIVDKNNYIHRENFYKIYIDEWEKLKINDSSLLYNLCRYYFGNEYNFFTPYIQVTNLQNAITYKKIILDYFQENNNIIDIEKSQKDIANISSTKDFSLIYQLRNYNIKVFRMAFDRMTLLDKITFDDINHYQIKKRLKEYFNNNEYASESDLDRLSKGLYYYVNNEKCYMNLYSLSSYIDKFMKSYYVINSMGINNYITSKYVVTKEKCSYIEFLYKQVRKHFPNKINNKNDILKFIRDNNLLSSIPNNLLNDYVKYESDKIIFID